MRVKVKIEEVDEVMTTAGLGYGRLGFSEGEE